MGHFLRLLVLVDQAGDQLQQPGVGELLHRPDAELLDEHHAIALRVVGQHADRVMADEQFPTDFPAHAAVELAMPQAQAIETIEAAEAFLALHELDVTGGGFEGFGHPRLTSLGYVGFAPSYRGPAQGAATFRTARENFVALAARACFPATARPYLGFARAELKRDARVETDWSTLRARPSTVAKGIPCAF